MKTNLLLLKTIAVAVLLVIGVIAKATTTITVGPSPASFLTIAAAYNSISDATGGYIIELQSDYNPAGETYPIVLGAKTGAIDAASGITIRPKAGNTAMFAFTAATEQIFDLNAATWVTIDGLDATKFVVNNTTASATASQCVRLTADASNNTIKNITAISICQKVTSGAIAIISAAPTAGCAGNTITNCTIKDDGMVKNTCGIYVSDSKSTNTTITNNNIENVAGVASNAGYGIAIASADGAIGTNTVASNNIYWTSATPLANTTSGIYTANAVTKIESNHIGYAASDHTGTASLSNKPLYGIYVVTALANPCQYNVIANINLTGATTAALTAHAIALGGTTGGGTFNANTIENITITGTANCEFRILQANTTSNTTKVYSNNIIRNCSAVAGTATSIATIVGLSNSSASAANSTYSNNQVYGLSAGDINSTAANVVSGFRSGFNLNATNIVVERNLIYNLSVLGLNTNTTGIINGIYLSASSPSVIVRNNMVSLGKDFTLDNNIYGISQNGVIAANHVYKIYHNSVYIGGAQTAAEFTTKNTYAFYCAATGIAATTNDLKNNIFANQRTMTGTGYHYAVGFSTASVLKTCDNNLYWGQAGSSPLGSAAAVDKADLAAWKDAVVSGSDAASFSSNPQFIAATNATPNLHIDPMTASEADNNGVFFADVVTNDFDNNTRLGTDLKADIGADEFTFGVTGLTSSSVANMIYSSNRKIVIEGATIGSAISVYSVTGQLVKTIKVKSEKSTIAVENGIYIVKTANQVSKVIVK